MTCPLHMRARSGPRCTMGNVGNLAQGCAGSWPLGVLGSKICRGHRKGPVPRDDESR